MRSDFPKNIGLISVFMDLGAGRRGVDMGPSAIRIARLVPTLESLGYSVTEMGAIHAPEPESTNPGESNAHFLREVSEVCRRLKERVEKSLEKKCFPLVLGGDHSIALGTVAGIAAFQRRRKQKIGLIWVDAHADMNTSASSPSGNVHGMPLAALLGQGESELTAINEDGPSVQPENVSILGGRDLDPGEKALIRELGVRVFTMSEIDERGVAICMDEALARANEGTSGYHISFDADAIDPVLAPGVGTPVPGGLTFREAHLICEKAARAGKLLGLEMVEVNPVLDEKNKTAELAVGLASSALGKSIL